MRYLILAQTRIITYLSMWGLGGFLSDPAEVIHGQRIQISVPILKLKLKCRAKQVRRPDGKAVRTTVRTQGMDPGEL